MDKKNIKKIIFFAVILVLVFIFSDFLRIHKEYIILEKIFEDSGTFGMVIFSAIFSIAVMFAVPITILIITASSLFGVYNGIIISSIGSTIGAGLAFLAARYFIRDSIHDLLGKNKQFKKLNYLSIKRGDIIVAIVRLVPIFPTNMINYGFGLTKIHFWRYLFWTWLCMLPEITFLVFGTRAVLKIILEKKFPLVYVTTFLIIGVTLFLIIRLIRRKEKL